MFYNNKHNNRLLLLAHIIIHKAVNKWNVSCQFLKLNHRFLGKTREATNLHIYLCSNFLLSNGTDLVKKKKEIARNIDFIELI